MTEISEVSFDCSAAESALVRKIVKRAKLQKLVRDVLSSQMDIIATHANGNRLDLEKFLGFDDFNFAHDFCGIARHLDRETGKLLDCFSPRCSAHTSAES